MIVRTWQKGTEKDNSATQNTNKQSGWLQHFVSNHNHICSTTESPLQDYQSLSQQNEKFSFTHIHRKRNVASLKHSQYIERALNAKEQFTSFNSITHSFKQIARRIIQGSKRNQKQYSENHAWKHISIRKV